jgi:hypothetical protein
MRKRVEYRVEMKELGSTEWVDVFASYPSAKEAKRAVDEFKKNHPEARFRAIKRTLITEVL